MKFLEQYRTYANLVTFNQIENNGMQDSIKRLALDFSERWTKRNIEKFILREQMCIDMANIKFGSLVMYEGDKYYVTGIGFYTKFYNFLPKNGELFEITDDVLLKHSKSCLTVRINKEYANPPKTGRQYCISKRNMKQVNINVLNVIKHNEDLRTKMHTDICHDITKSCRYNAFINIRRMCKQEVMGIIEMIKFDKGE